MKKHRKTIMIFILILFILFNSIIFIKGIKRYGDNWIDFSKEPSIFFYEGKVYYEISEPEYSSIEGKYELMNKYVTGSGEKANLFSYYLPTILVRRVAETRDSAGTPISLNVSALVGETRYYKLSEEESQ